MGLKLQVLPSPPRISINQADRASLWLFLRKLFGTEVKVKVEQWFALRRLTLIGVGSAAWRSSIILAVLSALSIVELLPLLSITKQASSWVCHVEQVGVLAPWQLAKSTFVASIEVSNVSSRLLEHLVTEKEGERRAGAFGWCEEGGRRFILLLCSCCWGKSLLCGAPRLQKSSSSSRHRLHYCRDNGNYH